MITSRALVAGCGLAHTRFGWLRPGAGHVVGAAPQQGHSNLPARSGDVHGRLSRRRGLGSASS